MTTPGCATSCGPGCEARIWQPSTLTWRTWPPTWTPPPWQAQPPGTGRGLPQHRISILSSLRQPAGEVSQPGLCAGCERSAESETPARDMNAMPGGLTHSRACEVGFEKQRMWLSSLACMSIRADDECLRGWQCSTADTPALWGLCSSPRSLLPGAAAPCVGAPL